MKTLSIFCLLAALATQPQSEALAYNYRDDDEFYTDYDPDEMDMEREEKNYDDQEKNKFIFGVPGTERYNQYTSPELLMELEIMWEIDYEL